MLKARVVLIVVAGSLIVAALSSLAFRAMMIPTLERADMGASQSIGRVYVADHRDRLSDWLSSPGPESLLLVDTGVAAEVERRGRNSLHGRGYRLTIHRLIPGVTGMNTDAPPGITDSPPENLLTAVRAGDVVNARSNGARESGQESDGPSFETVHTYIPVTGASGRVAGMLEVSTAIHPVSATVSQKQAVFFAGMAATLVLIGYVIAVFLGRRRRAGRHASQALARQFSGLIDKLDAVAVLVDRDRKVIHANPAAKSARMGPAVKEEDHAPGYRGHPGRDRSCDNHGSQSSLSGGRPSRNLVEADDGQRLELISLPVRDDDGSPLGAIEVVRAVAEPGHCPPQRQRAPGSHETDSAYRIQAELVAKFSHEIRTPLNAVLGMADLLRLTPLTRKQRTYAHTIQSSGEMLLSLIDNVLDFSRLEFESLELQENELDIVRLLDDILDIMGYFAYSKSVELIGSIHNPLDLRIIGDKQRLRQILVNLIGNAIKYTDRGEIIIEIDCQPVSDSGYELDIQVQDSGIGIDPSIRQKLFLPFVSKGSQDTTAHGSTGLGLAICKRLVEHMNGRIELIDRDGGGTIAGFSIPVRGVRQSDRTSFGRPAEFPGRVLIAHRNRVAADSLRRLFDCWSVDSEVAVSTGDIVKHLRDATDAGPEFDVAILDSDLGTEHRLEQVRAIRATPGLETLPVVLLVPITESLEVGEISTLGPIRCVNKPVLTLQLREQLASLSQEGADEWRVGVEDAVSNLRNPMNILIAEDNPVNARLLLKMLQTEGHDADVVTNGLAVLKAVRELPYDLVLMDCQMPGMDGDEVTREIHRNARQYHVPALIVAITADNTEQTRKRCLDSGMDDFLVKPIRLDRLRNGLARWSMSIFGVSQSAPTQPRANQLRDNLLDKIGRIDEDFLGSYIDLFLEDTDRRLEVLAEAVSRGDLSVADRECHALKGGCMEFGAERMSRLCEEISAAAKSGNGSSVATLFTRLQKEYLRLRPVYESALIH